MTPLANGLQLPVTCLNKEDFDNFFVIVCHNSIFLCLVPSHPIVQKLFALKTSEPALARLLGEQVRTYYKCSICVGGDLVSK